MHILRAQQVLGLMISYWCCVRTLDAGSKLWQKGLDLRRWEGPLTSPQSPSPSGTSGPCLPGQSQLVGPSPPDPVGHLPMEIVSPLLHIDQ